MVEFLSSALTKIDGIKSATFDASYRADIAKILFSTTILTRVGIASDMANLFQTIYGASLEDDEKEGLAIAMGLLVEEGFLNLK